MSKLNLQFNDAEISITIKQKDLVSFSEQLIKDAIEQYKIQIESKPKEFYYSTNQVCEILSVRRGTLQRWAKLNYLNPIKIGGNLRYSKQEVESLIKTE